MNKESVAAEKCGPMGSRNPAFEFYTSRETQLGSLHITRALPVKAKRLIGPWCFLDRYGPLTFAEGKPMDVAPHPHIGLQTVSWLLEGEVLHNDSLGFEALVRAGGVNVMTAGAGISHSEQTPKASSGRLNGVQLWIAMPDQYRNAPASLQHIASVPVVELTGGIIRVFAGTLCGTVSPAQHYSEIIGADVQVHPCEAVRIGLSPNYEHAIVALSGDCSADGHRLEEKVLYYLGINRSEICFTSRNGGRLLLIGGPPFPETILMWWNFVARSPEEIARARADWEQHDARFGQVRAYMGARLEAPTLDRIARANPIS
jgi:redox-sensitive bicupin YhaK (pirin superfamily)